VKFFYTDTHLLTPEGWKDELALVSLTRGAGSKLKVEGHDFFTVPPLFGSAPPVCGALSLQCLLRNTGN